MAKVPLLQCLSVASCHSLSLAPDSKATTQGEPRLVKFSGTIDF